MTEQTVQPPRTLYWCKNCQMLVEAVKKGGYERGPHPTGYEWYYLCPTCDSEVEEERPHE